MTKNPNTKNLNLVQFSSDEIGDNHMFTSIETPLKKDAFLMSDDEKKQKISFHFKEIMEILGLDLTDDSLKGTPDRVAKMYVEEIFSGLKPENKPKVALFENKYQSLFFFMSSFSNPNFLGEYIGKMSRPFFVLFCE